MIMDLFAKKKETTAAQETSADVSPQFREERREYPVVTHSVLNPWSTIKKIVRNEGEEYYYMERAGVDSVAFMLFDGNNVDHPFGLIRQFRGNFGEWQVGCYTGSLDKPELSLAEIVVEEVKEESGYTVGLDRVNFVCTECAGSQSSERVHLYIVDVTGLTQEELEPESPFEENTDNLWRCEQGVIMGSDDWKAKLILLCCMRDGRLEKPKAY